MLNKTTLKQIFTKVILRRGLPMSLVPSDYKLPTETKIIDDIASKLGYVPCNTNFDDLCPKYYDEDGLDFGGNVEKGISVEIRKLLEDYPHIALTFFVIPNSMMSRNCLKRTKQEKNRCDISSAQNAEWLDYYKSLAREYNIEYAMHGCYHWQFENKLFGHHAEFAFKQEDETRNAITEGLSICKAAGLNICGFRQPGWDINSDLSLCRVLKEAGFKYIAGSSSNAGFNAGRQRVSNYHPTLVDGLLNFPQNILLDWSFNTIRRQIDRIVALRGIISIKGHFVNTGIPNSFSMPNIAKLRQTLDYLSSEYGNNIEYLTFKQITKKI